MIKNTFAACFLSAVTLAATCLAANPLHAAESADDTIQVIVSIDQKITLEGKPVEPAKLPARLKSAGAGKGTMIRVLIQKNTPEKTIKEIAKALATGGYRKFVFTQPKQAEAFVAEPGRK